MSSIDLYTKSPDNFDQLQSKRPDYVGAQKAFVDLAIKYLKDKDDVSIVDFCCGTGGDSKLLTENISIDKITLVDINKDFLHIAVDRKIKASTVLTIESDILNAKLKSYNDAVISMFAYHHVPDKDKIHFVNKAKASLKPGGIVFLGEIYSPDKKTTLDYYKYLIEY